LNTLRNRINYSNVRLRGNIGGYLPALIKWGSERLREAILAHTDAYVDAFSLAGAPVDALVETAIKTSSLQMAGGTASGIRGKLDLMSKRTGMPMNHGAGAIDREIGKSRVLALGEAMLRLERQRIKVARVGTNPGTALGLGNSPVQAALSQLRHRRTGPRDEVGAVRRREFMAPFLVKETLSAIATRSGVHHSSLHRWLDGKSSLRADNRAKLASHLKVTAEAIPN
jgi:hypothetical protein